MSKLILILILTGYIPFNIEFKLNEIANVECPRNRCGSGRRGISGDV